MTPVRPARRRTRLGSPAPFPRPRRARAGARSGPRAGPYGHRCRAGARAGRLADTRSDQAAPDRLGDDMRAAAGAQAALEPGDQLLDGALGVAHSLGDLARAVAVGD